MWERKKGELRGSFSPQQFLKLGAYNTFPQKRIL